MYAVIGATGNTGRVVAEDLLAAGLPVRVIGRSEDRLAPLVARGAEAAVGDVSDADFVARACDGVGGVYHLIPPRFDTDLRAWLFTIMHNLYVNLVKRSSRSPEVALSEDVDLKDTRTPGQELAPSWWHQPLANR